MFSGNFAKGFITGLADSVNREIQKDMDRTEKNISRISQIQVESDIQEAKESKQKEKELKKELKRMQGELQGSTDAVQYLIDQYGYERAKEYSSILAAQQTSLGLSPLDQLGLAERDGRSVTLDELIAFNNPVTRTKRPKLTGGVAVGFGKLFGGEQSAISRLEKMTDDEVAAYNLDIPDNEEILKTMPPALQGKLRPYMLGRLADPGDESKRLNRIALTFKAKGQSEEAKALKLEADALYVMDNVGKTGKMTIGEVNSTSKILNGALAMKHGLKGIETEDGFIVDPAEDEANKEEYLRTSGKIMDVLSNYVVANGVNSYAKGLQIVKSAIAENKNIVYIPPSEGGRGRIVIEKDNVLFNKTGTPVLSKADDASADASSSAINKEVVTIEQQIRSTRAGSAEAEELIAKARRKNPNFIPPAGY
jgi:hypothetical protein